MPPRLGVENSGSRGVARSGGVTEVSAYELLLPFASVLRALASPNCVRVKNALFDAVADDARHFVPDK